MVLPIAAILAGAEIASNIANVIQVGIMVNDALTPTLDSYEGRIENLDQATDSWLNTFTRGIPSGALSGFTTAIDYVKQGLWEAAQIQTSIIASSSDLANNLKIPIGEARKVIEDSQVAISAIAAALPGETAGYADIYRSISGTLSKTLSGDEFTKQSEEFTKRIGVLAAIRGADASTAGNASNRFLAGTMGFGEAVVQDIFQRNPALYSALLDQLKEQQVDPEDWKKVQQGVRTKIFSAALAKAAPDALIAEFEGTFQGTIETLRTQVFDPISGLFGLLRRLPSQGGRNVLDAANGVLQALNGLKDNLVAIAKSLGINLDPMYYLIQVFDNVTDIVSRLHLAVLSADPVADFGAWVKGLPQMIGDWAISAIRFISTLLDRLIGSGIKGSELGSIIGQVINLFESVKDRVLDNIDVKQIAEIYFRISREIADAQSAIWWESIKIIPTRLGNYFSEMWVNLAIGFQPIRVVWSRFIDGFMVVMNALNNGIDTLMNPIAAITGAVAKGAVIQQDINAPNVASSLGLPFGGLIDSSMNTGREWAGKLLAPKPKPQKTAFNPVFTINANTNANADEIASLANDKMYESYLRYQSEMLT
jgi:hypothetical protein